MSRKVTKTVETFIGTGKREEPKEVTTKESTTREETPKLTYIKTNQKIESISVPVKKPIENIKTIDNTKTPANTKNTVNTKPTAKKEETHLVKTNQTIKETMVEIIEKPRLSPLRTRLKERTENVAIIIEEPVHQKSKTSKPKAATKPKKEKESKPVVYKSPTWYKSPRVKLIKPENQVLKDLLRKDPRYTEREVEKIVSDHN